MTFKLVRLSGEADFKVIVCADNDNPDPLVYEGICRWCKGEQVSNDPDVLCLRCGEFVEYTPQKTPVF